MIKLTDMDEKQIYSIPLDVKTKLNYKGEYDGTDCNSVISLTMYDSFGFADKQNTVTAEKSFMPVSVPYLWNLAVEGKNGTMYLITGRTLSRLKFVLERLAVSAAYQSATKKTIGDGNVYYPVLRQIKEGIMGRTKDTQPHYNLRVYGHQLQFQTLRNLYEKNFETEITPKGKIIRNVFSRAPRTFMNAKAVGVYGFCDIQFFETETLVKKTLQEWADDEDMNIIVKAQDIKEIKTPNTPLHAYEIEAAENNSLIINYGMQKMRARFDNDLREVPLTSTGIVRRELQDVVCKTEPWGEDEKHGDKEEPHGSKWSRLCASVNRNLTPEDYARLRQIFTGGLCITNRFNRGRVMRNIDAYDIRSAYVGVMCHFKYPVTDFVKIPSNQFNKYINETDVLSMDRKEAWYGHFTFHNLKSKTGLAYWIFNKNRPHKTDDDIKTSDGRLVSCNGAFDVYLTDLDFQMFKKFYSFDSFETHDIWTAKTSLLPENLIQLLLKWFQQKSVLTGRARNEVKTKLASTYGIMVTRLYDDDTVFYEGWRTYNLDGKLFKDKRAKISSLRTIGSYQIGVWVTAWQRYVLGNLLDDDVTYCDTDSLMGDIDISKIEAWHNFLKKRRREVCKVYESLDTDMFGQLGFFEKENHFEEFKAIGQKRYSGSYYEDGELKIKNTIAGLPKKNAGLKIKTPRDLTERLVWDENESGLLGKEYNDNQPSVKWTDRDGKTYWSQGIKFGAVVYPITFTTSKFAILKNVIEFLGTDLYTTNGAPDMTDPLFIKESLDD